MKAKGILIALTLVMYTSFNLYASAISEQNTIDNDPVYKWINIRVNLDNQVVLRAACFEGEKRVNLVLRIYSENNELVYETSIHKKGDVIKKYDLSNFPEGKYTFEIHKKLKKIYSKEVVKSMDYATADAGNPKMVIHEL